MRTGDKWCSECNGTGICWHPNLWNAPGSAWWYCTGCNGTGIAPDRTAVGVALCVITALMVIAAGLGWYLW